MCIGISLSINLIDWRETRFSSGMQVSWSIATDIDVRITHQLPEMSRCTNCQWAKLKINQRLTWCFKYTFFFGCNGRCSARCSCRRSYSCKMCTRKGLPCRSSCPTPIINAPAPISYFFFGVIPAYNLSNVLKTSFGFCNKTYKYHESF